MSGTVAPLNVSPFIKAARWTFLILGIFYGANRWKSLKAYEEKVGPKRIQELHEKYLRLKEQDALNTRNEITALARDFEVTEFPPGWDKDL